MRAFFWITGIAAGLWALYKAGESEGRGEPSVEQYEGFTVQRSRAGSQEMIRFRGSYDDIMRSLGVVNDRKPPLPSDLDVERLRSYSGGCPHCGATSMVGENMWRYQELSRTRGYLNNTTTYLCRCKKCSGFMKTKVDHDD